MHSARSSTRYSSAGSSGYAISGRCGSSSWGCGSLRACFAASSAGWAFQYKLRRSHSSPPSRFAGAAHAPRTPKPPRAANDGPSALHRVGELYTTQRSARSRQHEEPKRLRTLMASTPGTPSTPLAREKERQWKWSRGQQLSHRRMSVASRSSFPTTGHFASACSAIPTTSAGQCQYLLK